MKPCAVRLALALLVMPAGVLAQSAADPSAPNLVGPGVRIRLLHPTTAERPRVGRIVDVGPDTLHVQLGRDRNPTAIARREISRLEVSVGRADRRKAGARLGAVLGGAAGAVWVLGSRADACPARDVLCSALAATWTVPGMLWYGGLGAGVGAFLGKVVGSIVPTDVWAPLPPPAGPGA